MAVENNRYKDLEWVSKVNDTNIFILGAGGIGSWLAFYLSRIGFPITIMDDDMVNEINFAGQLFNVQQINNYKVNAVHSFAINNVLTDNNESLPIETIVDKYTNYLPQRDSVLLNKNFIISAVDNMEARKCLFDAFCRKIENVDGALNNTTFIDGRLLAEQFSIYTVNSIEDIEKYKTTLFSDREVQDVSCTVKQTSHIAALIGATMTQIITNNMINRIHNSEILSVPFETSYYGPMLQLTTD